MTAARILKERAEEVPIIASLTGPVSLATSLVDPLLYYRALRLNKEAVHNLNRLAVENALIFGDALVEAGADAICIADPSATGDLIGRAAFQEFVSSLHQHDDGAFPPPLRKAFHCAYLRGCQTLGAVLQGLSAEAVSVDSVVGIQHLRSMVPGKVTMGNISTYRPGARRTSQAGKGGRTVFETWRRYSGARLRHQPQNSDEKHIWPSPRRPLNTPKRHSLGESVMAIVSFYPDRRSIEVPRGSTILQAARKAGIMLETPCNCVGICSKCAVRLDADSLKNIARRPPGLR